MRTAGFRLAESIVKADAPAVLPSEPARRVDTMIGPVIVLVEDSNSDAYLVRLALDRRQLAANLTHFNDSEKAIEWFSSVQGEAVPDLLILDLNIPRRDGFEVLAALKGLPLLNRMPVMVLTSSISPEDRRRAAAAGVRRFLSKPMMLDDFLRAVGTAVEETIRESSGNPGH